MADENAGEQDSQELERRRQQHRQMIINEPVAVLGLSVRVVNALQDAGIWSVYDLLQRRPAELKEIGNIGNKTLNEIFARLERHYIYRQGRKPAKETDLEEHEIWSQLEQRRQFGLED